MLASPTSPSQRRFSGLADPALIRFGTRGSALALAQTDFVRTSFGRLHPEVRIETTVVRTDGDVDKASPLTVIGGRGVFTTALQEAIRRRIVDAAVHSAKDLPSETPDDLRLIAFFNREDPRDVLISRHGLPLADLPPRPVIGTSSRRRMVQVLAVRPDAQIVELRGNVDTRIRKAGEAAFDGIILAAAGVARMGWTDRVTEYLPVERFVPSPGQGALAVETRASADIQLERLADLDDPHVSLPVRVERAFLRGIGGGCTTPVGAHATLSGDRVALRCMLAREDGAHALWVNESLVPDDAEAHAFTIAGEMLSEVGQQRPMAVVAVPGRPLDGLTVLVTRPGTSGASLETELMAAGATPVAAPTIHIAPAIDLPAIDAAVEQVGYGRYDWVVFTSGNAVDGMLRRVEAIGLSPVLFKAARVAAVGRPTAAKLRSAGIDVALIPDRFDGEAVRDALVATGVAGRRILLPRGNLARDVIASGLRDAGAAVDHVEVYRTEPATALDPVVATAIERGEFDVATFASSSCVRALAGLLPDGVRALSLSAIACLGPVTAETAREFGLRVDIVAEDATISGLVRALIDKRERIDALRGQRAGLLVAPLGLMAGGER